MFYKTEISEASLDLVKGLEMKSNHLETKSNDLSVLLESTKASYKNKFTGVINAIHQTKQIDTYSRDIVLEYIKSFK